MKNQSIQRLALIALALGLTAALATDAHSAEGGWTVHTVSVHVGASGLNNFNPGVGYALTDNFRVGALYNSYKVPSAYALGIYNVNSRFRVGAGVISGYTYNNGAVSGKASGVLPAVAAELDITKRLSVVWFGQAFNLEFKF